MSESPDETMILGAVPQNLCAPIRAAWPPAGLNDHIQRSFKLQELGRLADFYGSAGATRGIAERVYEVIGLYAGIGEQLGLACLLDHEFQCWAATRTKDRVEAVQKEMASRAIVELEAYYVLGISHSLMNLAVRHAALNQAARAAFTNNKKLNTDFPPHSDERKDWLSATDTRPVLKALRPVGDPLLLEVVNVVRDYVKSSGYKALDNLRRTHFHRWRLQSAGITGAGRGPWGKPTQTGGMSWSVYIAARSVRTCRANSRPTATTPCVVRWIRCGMCWIASRPRVTRFSIERLI